MRRVEVLDDDASALPVRPEAHPGPQRVGESLLHGRHVRVPGKTPHNRIVPELSPRKLNLPLVIYSTFAGEVGKNFGGCQAGARSSRREHRLSVSIRNLLIARAIGPWGSAPLDCEMP